MSGHCRAGRFQSLTAVLFSLICVCTGSPAAAGESVEAARAAAHAAEAAREGTGIPALPEEQVAAYLDGRAMWMAGVAELNHYPGPRQVLELVQQLGLTAEQQQATMNLYDELRPEAIGLGKQLVEQEQRLNRIFAWGQASEANIEQIVTDIGDLQARLRLTHLLAHISARELLTKEQLKRYDELQGYGEQTGENSNKMGCNAMHHHGR
jgi:Spy/CpxP family protein refolding chaperone